MVVPVRPVPPHVKVAAAVGLLAEALGVKAAAVGVKAAEQDLGRTVVAMRAVAAVETVAVLLERPAAVAVQDLAVISLKEMPLAVTPVLAAAAVVVLVLPLRLAATGVLGLY